jgi:signal transduction histidine kinase
MALWPGGRAPARSRMDAAEALPVFRSLTFKLTGVLFVILTLATSFQTWRVLGEFGRQWFRRQSEIAGTVLQRVRTAPDTGRLDSVRLDGPLEEEGRGGAAMRLYGPGGQLLDRLGSLDGHPAVGAAELERLREVPPGRPRPLVPVLRGLALGLRIDTGPDGPERYLVYSQAEGPEPWIRSANRLAKRNLIASIAFASVAGFLLARWLRRRLDRLGTAFQAVAAGELSTRVPEPRERELAGLARSFNHMASELEKAQAERRQAEAERRTFMAQASHELRTPLTALQGYLETLTMQDLELAPEQERTYLERAYLEAGELGHRVEDLMELVRLERPGFRLAVAHVALAEVFDELARRYEPLAASAGVRLEGLAAAGELFGVWDRRRVVQAIGNLLHNAIKASPRGASVRVGAAVQGARVQVEVSDEGPGLQGYQDPSGLGLGLKIAGLLLEHHGGALRLEPAGEHGLRAVAELPPAAPAG